MNCATAANWSGEMSLSRWKVPELCTIILVHDLGCPRLPTWGPKLQTIWICESPLRLLVPLPWAEEPQPIAEGLVPLHGVSGAWPMRMWHTRRKDSTLAVAGPVRIFAAATVRSQTPPWLCLGAFPRLVHIDLRPLRPKLYSSGQNSDRGQLGFCRIHLDSTAGPALRVGLGVEPLACWCAAGVLVRRLVDLDAAALAVTDACLSRVCR